jgi:hypothetical protein
MRSLFLAFGVSTLTFLAEFCLDTTISLNMYRLYRHGIIVLLLIHFWDLYAEKEAKKLLKEVGHGIEQIGHE